ncbi:MAG: hypothetical protein EA349_07620 [Halomonadaceae bacterium]|nr:MAG: hypothetical protein EA349_07620 [Halomonadaceae bacterium]
MQHTHFNMTAHQPPGYRRTATAMLAAAFLLSGCLGSSSDDNDPAPRVSDERTWQQALSEDFAETVVDASSYSDLTGIDLLTGETTQDLENGTWDIALQRFNVVKLNGRGDNPVSAALANEQSAFYQNGDPVRNVFVNATPDAYAADLRYPYQPEDLMFMSESFQPAFGEWREWATYRSDLPAQRNGGGYVTANESHYWVVQSSEDAYFVVQLLDNDEPLFDTRDGDASFDQAGITLAVTPMQADGSFDTTQSELLSGDLDEPRGTVYLDLDTLSSSHSANAGWDIAYSVETSASGFGSGAVGVLRLNGGVSGEENVGLHVDSPFAASDLAELDGTDQGFGFSFNSDSVENPFTANEYFRYGVDGGHRLWPNFRVFAVDLDGDPETTDDIVLVQAVHYYHPDSGESAHITLRARLLENQ